ncbi:hypothetical protein [Chryseobacterium kwangjuense]|uniref:DUF1735 domain-containing protein n=1 Tax=Chryseobacterium kwangjuense TaxID=267125 RepID=A0A135WDI7_9FLAO|nr:hypothetical protein [Chryseobacterium kwangjuense]KXH82792.1 hypothetical protein AU378_10090 [Chryseobacterium kwangjuense]
MKKILLFLFLGAVGFTAYSCDNDDDVIQTVDYDTIAQMADITGSFSSTGNYTISQGLDIPNTYVVLVYRLSSGNVWQQIPKSVYLPDVAGKPTNRVFDYNFVFNSQNVEIRIDDENFTLPTDLTSGEISTYLSNQTFRIVLVPANTSGIGGAKSKQAAVDYSDYNAVVKYYNLDESKVKSTKVN